MDLEKIKHISRLLFLQIKNALSVDEAKELNDWRSSSSDCERIFHEVVEEENWEENIRRFVKTNEAKEAEWKAILQRTVKQRRQINWRRMVGYAALFVLVPSISYLSWNRLQVEEVENHIAVSDAISHGQPKATLILADGNQITLEQYFRQSAVPGGAFEVDTAQNMLRYTADQQMRSVEYHTLIIPRGGEYIVVLDDGTKVYLNSESELRYPTHFVGETRRVFLKGEAYFEVAHNAASPFVVDLDDIQVKVLGTCFGVRRYENEEEVMTTLVSGRVNVSQDGEEVALKPNEQALYNRKQDRMVVHTVDTRLFVGWKDGRLIFDNIPLETILTTLGRWYNFQVTYTNDDLKEIPFTLDIIRHSNIQTILNLLQYTGKIDFKIEQNTVIVK